MIATHAVAVARVAGRYPFVPTCTCGWEWRGYLVAHAAQCVADAHEAGEL